MNFFKTFNVTISAKAYSGNSIPDAQRNSYSHFLGSMEEFFPSAGDEIH